MFKFFQKKNVRFILFFSRDKNDTLAHNGMKLLEVDYKICTQHITAPVMEKALSQRGAQMVLDNILMKVHICSLPIGLQISTLLMTCC
jgi:hypothetical protein